jgi:hypothetical protein
VLARLSGLLTASNSFNKFLYRICSNPVIFRDVFNIFGQHRAFFVQRAKPLTDPYLRHAFSA